MDGLLTPRALDCMLFPADRTRNRLRPGPQRGRQPAFSSERWNYASLSRLTEQTQRPIEVRFPAAVRSRNDIEALEGNHKFPKRTVIRNGDSRQHERTIVARAPQTGAIALHQKND